MLQLLRHINFGGLVLATSGGKLGILSMLFPPDREVGALRVGKFAKWLELDHGWEIQVVKRESKVESKSVQRGTKVFVHDVQSLDSMSIVKWISRFRRKRRVEAKHCGDDEKKNSVVLKRSLLARASDILVVPDNEQLWAWRAFRKMSQLIKAEGVEILFSSGPPHSAHIAAYLCKKRFGLPWVADLRDPWCDNPYELALASSAGRLNSWLESKCLYLADLILTNTEPARDLLLRRYPAFSKDKVVTFPNGIDEEDFEGLSPCADMLPTTSPVLLHAGSLYSKRNPIAIFHALAELKLVLKSLPCFVFIGTWEPELLRAVKQIVDRHELSAHVVFLESQPRNKTLEALMAADGLLLVGDSAQSQVQIPAKMFEYLFLNKPVLSLFRDSSPVNTYLRDYCGFYSQADPNDVASVKLAIARMMTSSKRRTSKGRCQIGHSWICAEELK